MYARHRRGVFTIAYARLRDGDLADDVVQVAFLKAWRAIDTFDVRRPTGPWIHAIARRAAIDVGRRERRHSNATVLDSNHLPSEIDLDRGILAGEVRHAVNALDGGHREIVHLQYFEQLTHAEIASRLGLPIGTVKSRSHRAHRRLESALAHLRDAVG